MTKPLFLDTSIQVDRVLKAIPPKKMVALDAMLSQFDYFVACSYSKLEFKRVVIQNLSLVLRYLVEERSFFGALYRAQAIGAARPRQAATLASIFAWVGLNVNSESEVQKGGRLDLILASKAESYIRNAIPYLWLRFESSVDSITDKTKCRRAMEAPARNRDGTFDTTVHQRLCDNQECNQANFFRENLPLLRKLRDDLYELSKDTSKSYLFTGELQVALRQLDAAIANPSSLYNYKNCLNLADVWIHLESVVCGIKDFGTKNYKESQTLAPLMGLTMQRPSSIDDETE